MISTKNFNRFNFLLAAFIIVWGAWVRLSGSGAGCGEHWPLCNGEVIPPTESYKTMVEFIHRLTSGIYGITVLGAMFVSFKEFGKSHRVAKASIAVLVLTIIEALIGAVLVKKGLVDKNDSNLRAFVIAIHLANTLFLISSHVFVEFFTTHKNNISWPKFLSFKNISMFVLFVIVASSGAVTALGNTLFPDRSLIEGMGRDFDSSAPFLIQLRIYHPILAMGLGLLIISEALSFGKEKLRYQCMLLPLIIIALLFGVVNWLLLSPHWGALTHLFIADLLWSVLILSLLEKSLVHE